ncbi:nucleoside hydrolase [Fibrella arboris]|uniref:nucleoside hydrolase n=1 Tax=Fibrella arboris TaxID=3242486 RepID=UPI003520619E
MYSSLRYLLLLFLLVTYPAVAQKSKPIPVIFDTDMGPDYDDVGAITMLHAYADAGRVTLLATIASSKYPRVVPVLSVLNTYFGRPALPIGVPKGWAVTDADKQHWSDTLVARYPHSFKTNEAAPAAVTLYRQLLAARPDRSVTIITVGFLTNLANLLQSPADHYSPLTGQQLVTRKVKQLVSMAGKFPAGHEYNVHRDTTASRIVYTEWPTPMLLSGFEIGAAIKTGLPLVQNSAIKNSPVKDVFRISLPFSDEDHAGRMSWDQTAVLVAVEGTEPYYTVQTGRLILGPNGSNTWDATGKGQAHLVVKRPPAEVQAHIDKLMQHQTGTKSERVKE